MSPLTLQCDDLADAVLITVTGEVDFTNADRLESYVQGARRPGRPVVLDLGGLRFMDSTGLHVLLRLHGDVRRQGTGLHLAAVNDVPARVLQLTGVWEALTIHPSVQQATAVLNDRLREPS